MPSAACALRRSIMYENSVDPDVVGDHRVRVLDIMEDEEAVIRVRTKFHISLVFSSCTIELFEKDGVVYTRQEYTPPEPPQPDDIQSVGEREYPSGLETPVLHREEAIESQSSVVEEPYWQQVDPLAEALWMYSDRSESRYSFCTPETPQEVRDMTGGGFMRVNEEYASSLERRDPFEMGDIARELDLDLNQEYLRCGETQIVYTQLETPPSISMSPWVEFEETQIE